MLNFDYSLLTYLIKSHPHLGLIVVFLISFSESIAIIGSLIPGSVVMTAIGILVGSGALPIWPTLICGSLGAIVGDTLSYLIGYHFKTRIHDIWPFNRYPNTLLRAKDFVKNHGGKSIFIGRFVGPIRAMVPLISGMLNMPPKRYFIASISAAIAWAPLFMFPGILVGTIALTLPTKLATKMIFSVIVFLFVVWVIANIIKYIYQKTHEYCILLLDSKWKVWQKQSSKKWLCWLLRHTKRPNRRGQLLLAINTIIALLAFLFVFIQVTTNGPLLLLNDPIYHLMRGFHFNFLTKTMVFISIIGFKFVLLPAIFAIFVWFLLCRNWATAIHWIFGTLSCIGSAYIIKHLFYSPRPAGIIHQASSSSFPSGHVSCTIITYGLLALLIGKSCSSRSVRNFTYLSATIITLCVAFSRLYLEAHWLTDVSAAALLGLFFIGLTNISYNRNTHEKLYIPGLLLVASISLAISCTWNLTHSYKKLLLNSRLSKPNKIIQQYKWWNDTPINTLLYRNNRLGTPAQILNLEWADSLANIKESLQKQGWKIIQTTAYFTRLKSLAKQQPIKQETLFPDLYQDAPPVIKLLKIIPKKQTSIVISLWDTNITLTPSKTPLFVGTLNYNITKKQWLLFNKKINKPVLNHYVAKSIVVHKKYNWRIKTISSKILPKCLQNSDSPMYILLLKQKTLILNKNSQNL